jgi:CRISPR/Cas system CSM-associated protein Csm3 (group 7 of RAMP superfamily)
MSPQTDEKLLYRVLIEGTLTTKTFLHIGSEKPVEEVAAARQRRAEAPAQVGDKPRDMEKSIPLPVVTGSDNKAIIPGSALRGAIRSRLKKYGLDEDLMGRPAEPGGEESQVHGKARRVFVQDATIIEPCGQGLEFDDTRKCVDKIAMTAISRWRRAPQDEMLRSVEAVPPEVLFRVRIGICGDPEAEKNKREVTRDEIAKVLAALGHCDWREDSTGNDPQIPAAKPLFKPLQLGAFQKAGWGKVEWKTCKITVLTRQGLEHWLELEPNPVQGRQGWELCSEPVDGRSFARPEPPGTPDHVIHLPLTLAFESTFFTQDQREHTKEAIRAAHDRDPEKTPEKLAKVMRVDGRAWLSGQSLKGALRSQFERILRTKGIPCCDPSLDKPVGNDIDPSGLTRKRCDPIRSADEVGDLCPACQVFGNGGWASTIEVSPFEEIDKCTIDTRREFLAISRFTGGGVPGLKFSADVAVQPKLRGHTRINLERLRRTSSEKHKPREGISPIWPKFAEAQRLGAVLHLFRDFAEGDIPVGAGRSKGFGKFKVAKMSDESVAALNKQPLGLALCAILGRANTPEETLLLEREAQGWLSQFDKLSPAVVNAAQPWWQSFDVPTVTASNQPSGGQVTVQKGSYNPYHWVPAVQPASKLLTSVTDFGKAPAHRHDVYAQDGISGEITVKVKSITPVFVGGERKSKGEVGRPAKVDPFTIHGNPAIPSTTLRGLLSSTYEIATASVMRVLDKDKIYSYRKRIIPWNQRPAGRQYQLGQGVPRLLENLTAWGEVPQASPRGNGQSVPDFYCLDFGDRHAHMPIGRNGRSHEIRLNPPNPGPAAIRITDQTLEQFYRIADDRTEETKDDDHPCPYEPKGQRPNGRRDSNLWYRLKDEDFVYFETKLEKGELVADRISLAQIWRDDVKKPIGELFGSGDVVPLQLDRKHPDAVRKNLTMAETAFGFVWPEDSEKPRGAAKDNAGIPAFASRIVVSDATMPGVSENSYSAHALPGGKKALKVLNSPKPPSPAFYFDPVLSRFPSYKEIADKASKPRGRKMYLHLDWDNSSRPWESQNPPPNGGRANVENGVCNNDKVKKLQTAVECVKDGTEFTFTIGFDNLTNEEFLTLCYMLRPTPNYRHKLGMGKPLGLGSIAFDVGKIRVIDRLSRYSTNGFCSVRSGDVAGVSLDEWVDARARQWRTVVSGDHGLSNSLTVLEKIGTTTVGRMQYPMARKQNDGEWELFNWSSENRQLASMKEIMLKGCTQFLRKIETSGHIDPLPWPCNILVIKGDTKLTGSFIQSLRASCFSYEESNDVTDANVQLQGFRDQCPGSLTFVLGTKQTLKGITGIASSVWTIKLTDLTTQRPDRDARRDQWTEDQVSLSDLERVLNLGAQKQQASK